MSTALRLLLALDIPPHRLERFGAVFRAWAGDWTAHQLLHQYSYWRGVKHAWSDRDGWRALTSGTLILMYHAFGRPGEPASRYVIPARRFARQMDWLKRTGHRVLSLADLIRYRR